MAGGGAATFAVSQSWRSARPRSGCRTRDAGAHRRAWATQAASAQLMLRGHARIQTLRHGFSTLTEQIPRSLRLWAAGTVLAQAIQYLGLEFLSLDCAVSDPMAPAAHSPETEPRADSIPPDHGSSGETRAGTAPWPERRSNLNIIADVVGGAV